MIGVLRREGQEFGHTDTEGRRPCEGRAETGVMGSQSHRLEEGRKESFPEPPEGAWSRWRLDFGLLASRMVQESLAVVLSCLVHGNLLLQPWRPYRLGDPGQVPSPSTPTVPLPGPLLTSPQCQPARDPSRIIGAWWASPRTALSVPGPACLYTHTGRGAGDVQTLVPWTRHQYLWGLSFLFQSMRASWLLWEL